MGTTNQTAAKKATRTHTRWLIDNYRAGIALLNAGKTFTTGYHGKEYTTPDQLRRWFIGELNHKINRKGEMPVVTNAGKWRKLGAIYQAGAIRDAQRLDAIHRIRLRVYQFETKECTARFAHLLAHHDD